VEGSASLRPGEDDHDVAAAVAVGVVDLTHAELGVVGMTIVFSIASSD